MCKAHGQMCRSRRANVQKPAGKSTRPGARAVGKCAEAGRGRGHPSQTHTYKHSDKATGTTHRHRDKSEKHAPKDLGTPDQLPGRATPKIRHNTYIHAYMHAYRKTDRHTKCMHICIHA